MTDHERILMAMFVGIIIVINEIGIYSATIDVSGDLPQLVVKRK